MRFDSNISRQMYEDFNLVYNNLSSNLAPGLSVYEISMYLTKAYFSIVDSLYQTYEANEKARKMLLPLVTDSLLTPSTTSFKHIVPESLFFKLPVNTLYVVYESVQSNAQKGCFKDKSLDVFPVSHDEFHSIYPNPFRLNNHRALRLDTYHYDIQDKRKVAELVVKGTNTYSYYIRYIMKPNPIILTSFEPYN
ncbi:MAG: hypothetical protein HUJ56_09560, partial [Erysipelotrichaceae bacterium]|nr:hypothetical protein [Erysipelotrichaceae bacterium]